MYPIIAFFSQGLKCRHLRGRHCESNRVNCGLTVEACFPGAQNGLGAIGNLEFIEDVGDVVARGLEADREALGDLLVCQMLRQEGKDFHLTLG